MERYSSYKDSGVQWIGKVPSHWRIPSIGKIFEIKAGGDAKPQYYSFKQDEEHPYPVYTNTKDSNSVYAYTSKPLYDSGTITVTGRGEIGRAIFRPVPYDAIIRLLSLRPKVKLVPKFYAFFIDSVIPFTSDSAAIGQLSAVQLKPKYVTFPPLAEQEKIVSYLENKTSKIDAYVADKEKEIELLQELKQKTIADAVTKGLNPDVKMKDSGISWIGDIPEHWEVKRIASLFTGKVQANTDFKYHHAFKFYYGTLVPKNEVGDVEEYRDTYVKYSVLQKDDIMINGLNLNYDFVSQRVAIAPSDGIITSAYVVARPRKGTNAQYYNYLFKTMDNMKLFHGMGTGIRLTLSFDEMKKQVVVVPPQDEQQSIVAYIEEKCEKIDILASELQSEIDYLKEYKQRLIADCVTGQVNVQNEMI